MSKSEMRFLRRELISRALQARGGAVQTFRYLKYSVRFVEKLYYGQELAAYV